MLQISDFNFLISDFKMNLVLLTRNLEGTKNKGKIFNVSIIKLTFIDRWRNKHEATDKLYEFRYQTNATPYNHRATSTSGCVPFNFIPTESQATIEPIFLR